MMTRKTWDNFVDNLENEWNRDWHQRKTLHNTVKAELETIIKKYNGTFGLKPKVLDAGCGTGQDYSIFTGTDYTGVDITQEMLDKFVEKYPTAHLEKADIHHLRFKDNEFDLVFNHDVLLHIDRWEQALQELWRVTKSVLVLKLAYVWNASTRTDVSPSGFIERKFNLYDVYRSVIQLNPKPVIMDAIDVTAEEKTSPDMLLKQIFVIRKSQ